MLSCIGRYARHGKRKLNLLPWVAECHSEIMPYLHNEGRLDRHGTQGIAELGRIMEVARDDHGLRDLIGHYATCKAIDQCLRAMKG